MDKLIHVFEYAVLGGLLRWTMNGRGWRGWFAAVACAAAVGAADELYQSTVPGRYSSSSDWMADLIGAGLGSAVLPILQQWALAYVPRFKRTGD